MMFGCIWRQIHSGLRGMMMTGVRRVLMLPCRRRSQGLDRHRNGARKGQRALQWQQQADQNNYQ